MVHFSIHGMSLVRDGTKCTSKGPNVDVNWWNFPQGFSRTRCRETGVSTQQTFCFQVYVSPSRSFPAYKATRCDCKHSLWCIPATTQSRSWEWLSCPYHFFCLGIKGRQIPSLFSSAFLEVTMSAQITARVSVGGKARVTCLTQNWEGSVAYKTRAEGKHHLWSQGLVLKDPACYRICAKSLPWLLQCGIPSVSSWKDKLSNI